MYIEVPAPDNERKHEYNQNHYSILGTAQLDALLQRTGFKVEHFNDLDFDINIQQEGDEVKTVAEKYFCILVTKTGNLDIK